MQKYNCLSRPDPDGTVEPETCDDGHHPSHLSASSSPSSSSLHVLSSHFLPHVTNININFYCSSDANIADNERFCSSSSVVFIVLWVFLFLLETSLIFYALVCPLIFFLMNTLKVLSQPNLFDLAPTSRPLPVVSRQLMVVVLNRGYAVCKCMFYDSYFMALKLNLLSLTTQSINMIYHAAQILRLLGSNWLSSLNKNNNNTKSNDTPPKSLILPLGLWDCLFNKEPFKKAERAPGSVDIFLWRTKHSI